MANKKVRLRACRRHSPCVSHFDPSHSVAIIVLGCKPYVKGGIINPELKLRVGKGVELYQREFGDFLLFSGGNPFSDLPEALIMKSLAPMVPKKDVVLEMHSKSTRENAVLSKRILLRKGVGDVILVTSPYHVSRALSIFRDVFGDNFHIRAVASDYRPRIYVRIWNALTRAFILQVIFPAL